MVGKADISKPNFPGALPCALALALVLALVCAAPGLAAPVARTRPPGGPLTRSDNTPFAPSTAIVGARWTSRRYDPPPNQSGDILPTVWSEDGGTYVLMDDGGVDVPLPRGIWRQSFARVTGRPPHLRFRHVGDPTSPPPRTWPQIGGNRDRDSGPLGPYYSIGFVEGGGTFFATLQRNWNWGANGPFTGLTGIAYSRDHGGTWRIVHQAFPAPLGNLNFVDGGGPGGSYPDGYVYAIGTEREFNASRLVLGRARADVADMTDPSRWQWVAGTSSPAAAGTAPAPVWTRSIARARPVLQWNGHITYPQMSYDPPLRRYLLTFTYSYSSKRPGLWNGGAELVILEGPSPSGPFSFVARSSEFGPSNGYGAGFPTQWISRDGRDLWLKWAANFAGCRPGLACSGKYGFNLAGVHLDVASSSVPPQAASHPRAASHPGTTTLRQVSSHLVYALPASVLLLLAAAGWRRRTGRLRRP